MSDLLQNMNNVHYRPTSNLLRKSKIHCIKWCQELIDIDVSPIPRYTARCFFLGRTGNIKIPMMNWYERRRTVFNIIFNGMSHFCSRSYFFTETWSTPMIGLWALKLLKNLCLFEFNRFYCRRLVQARN